MPETLFSQKPERSTSTPPKTTLSGSTFNQRREEIYRNLQESIKICSDNYANRKELASESNQSVANLCNALEDAFNYGLKQQQSSAVASATALLQNMHEIVTGICSSSNDVSFWDFCQEYLTAHERERYINLTNISTKCGRGRAFIRATLNENSLERYLLTWLSDSEFLQRYYSPWSLLLDEDASKELPKMINSLNTILFAIRIDTTELNAPTRTTTTTIVRKEPVIHAPTPVPITNTKRKTNVVERPIVAANSTEDLLKAVDTAVLQIEIHNDFVPDVDEIPTPPADNIEPYLEFLKQPLTPDHEHEIEDKSDTSSEYSKSSSANCDANQLALEEKLREMSERCFLLETRVAKLSLENRHLTRRLTQQFKESGIDPSSSLASNFLITIPQAKLFKSKHGSSYYAYDVHITMRRPCEHWSMWRRYRDFDKLHKSLLCTHPSVRAVEFPPKKHFGNKNLVFVEERRQQLQIYLLNLVETLPQVEACKTKAELQKIFPFLRER
ncbi:sorting nexin-29 [Teleopsis dalmanni]|uniref:sorting nexin-29 n=1 Tax=Teleopsis dalmanni TaxID=139649 RepID=UPI0018CE0BAF|nr:sorting nexin-29 [Teleopsis dalmanni]XP_037957149.1 sorting nexin-29 [Teleopsis dalmanni]XP_037957150.1 sorting nexin-29 [Teleopsis dalmanni]XP_037957151.1 sorting nexin-29 [Teleopsis dalmanni]XP_037957152.1 sorting nexin-29 [Teleopsis dalmanni]